MSRPPFTPLPDTDDPYTLLDVRPGTSAEQIRRAYLRRVKMYKPDRHPAEFRRVREAYDFLREHEAWFGVAVNPDDASPSEPTAEPPVEIVGGTSGQAELTAERSFDESGDDADEPEPHGDTSVTPPIEFPSARARERQARSAVVEDLIAGLTRAVHAALGNECFGDATDALLDPDVEALSSHPEFVPLLLETACAVVWKDPERFEALVERYSDLITANDTEHREGALLHRRVLASEREAWNAAVRGWSQLDRFVTLGASLRAPAEAELGLHLGKRAAEDPEGYLEVLRAASRAAPGTTAMFVGLAERWALHFGEPWPTGGPFEPPSLDQAGDAIVAAMQAHRVVRWEQVRPLLVTVLGVAFIWLGSPVMELATIAFFIGWWAWRAWARDPTERIYIEVIQPAAATWLWATKEPLERLAAAFEAKLPAKGNFASFVHPVDASVYPTLLGNDLTLLAFGVTAPMIPRLRPKRRR